MSTEEKEKLFTFNCSNCGVFFGIAKNCQEAWMENGKTFYCPNGHTLSWEKPGSELEKLRKEVVELRAKLEAANKKVNELTLELEIWSPSKTEEKAL